MNTKNQTQHKKWYDNTVLLIILFFILPPLGIYGVIKRRTSKFKKILYLVPAIFLSLFGFLLILSQLFPIDSYKEGLDYYNKKNYLKAYEYFQNVSPNEPNYYDAINKIAELKPIVDSLELLKNEKAKPLIIKNEKSEFVNPEELISFQQKWSDSIVKSWEGDFIISTKLILPDTIKFELSKNATKSFASNMEQTLPMYVSSYKRALKNKFGSQYDNYKTTITFLPNIEMNRQNDSDDWTRPVTLGTGLKIYSGNQYSKEYVGSLQCKFKDTSDGNTYYVVLKNNGSETYIQEYKFRSYYWVKRKDANSLHGVQLLKCY